MVKGGRDGWFLEGGCGDWAAKQPKEPLPSQLHPLAYPQAGAVCALSVFRRRVAGAGKGGGAYCTV